MRITLKQLAVFEAIARNGQVARAAQRLSLSAPAISMALAELEKQLDSRLFERVGNRLRLNAQGQLLLPLASQTLQQIEQIETLFASPEAELSGTLNVAASSTIGNYLLAKSAVAFCQQNTASMVEVAICNTQAVIDAVVEFRVEVGFIEGQCLDSKVAVTPWHKDKLLVFCHPAHHLAGKRVTPGELRGQAWIMREAGSGTRDCFINAANALAMQPVEKFSFSTPEAIKQAVRQGAGLAVLSELSLEKELQRKELALIHVSGLKLERQFYKIRHRSRNPTALCQAFERFCLRFLSLGDASRND